MKKRALRAIAAAAVGVSLFYTPGYAARSQPAGLPEPVRTESPELYWLFRSWASANMQPLLMQIPDDVVMHYADNRVTQLNLALADDPTGNRCLRLIYPPYTDKPAKLPAAPWLKGRHQPHVLTAAEADTLYFSVFLKLRHTYGDILDEKESAMPENDAILTCEMKTALYMAILGLEPEDAAGVLRWLWFRDGVF